METIETIGIILFIVGSLIFGALTDFSIKALLSLTLIVCGVVLFVSVDNEKSGYKQGQIDAIKGKIKYKLVEKENWEEVKP